MGSERSPVRWLVLVVVVITLLNLPGPWSVAIKSMFRESARPLQRAVDSTFGAARDYLASVTRIPGLLDENRNLTREVARLNAERNHWRMLEHENEELRKLLEFRSPLHTEWIAAKVLARSRDGWWQTVRLNKGSTEGVREEMPVVSMEGLVGRVVAVSKNTADVLLVSDPVFRVSARLVRSGSFGIVGGRGPSWSGQVFCRMEFIHRSDRVMPGDEVVTSGLGGVFPAGLAVGYVDRVYDDSSGLYQHADVITHADLGTLHHVFVIRQYDGNASSEGVGL